MDNRAIADAVAGLKPRKLPCRDRTVTRLAGLEPFSITKDTNFINIGERCAREVSFG